MIAVIKKCLIFEDCDYDCNPHKVIAVLFLRTAMIIVLTKYTIYEGYDHDRNLLYQNYDHDRSIHKIYLIFESL